MRIPLRMLAQQIESEFPDLMTSLDHFTCSTDRHIRGSRIRVPGKGRKGTRLQVFSRKDYHSGRFWDPLYEHRAGETYRRNSDVEDWIKDERARRRAADPSWFPGKTGILIDREGNRRLESSPLKG